MKALTSYPYPQTSPATEIAGLHNFKDRAVGSFSVHYGLKLFEPSSLRPEISLQDLLREEARAEIVNRSIPDLSQVCLDLYRTFSQNRAPYSAVQFLPVLKALNSIDRSAIRRFIKNPSTKHVLVHNDLIKVVLIHWKPGDYSNIHGHVKGGCVFKVLQGRLEEKRYTPDGSKQLIGVSSLKKNGMAYIDDNMAYHAVGNPYNTSAISLHVYTSGGVK